MSFILVALDHKSTHLSQLRALLSVAVFPIQYAIDYPRNLYEDLAENFRLRKTLLAEVRLLRDENLELKQRLQYLLALEAENNSLKMLTQTASKDDDKVMVAEVLQVDTTPYAQRVIINRGSKDKIYEGQPVVDAFGILGQVIEVGINTSVVLLLTDPEHALPIQSTRSGARAIAVGNNIDGKLLLNHVTLTADFEVGDVLVSSGLGQRFPRGYPVATIESIDRSQGGNFIQVHAKPLARPDVVQEVLLIWPKTDGSEEAP